MINFVSIGTVIKTSNLKFAKEKPYIHLFFKELENSSHLFFDLIYVGDVAYKVQKNLKKSDLVFVSGSILGYKDKVIQVNCKSFSLIKRLSDFKQMDNAQHVISQETLVNAFPTHLKDKEKDSNAKGDA